MPTRKLRSWFFASTSQPGFPGVRFLYKDKPTEATFRRLADSTAMMLEPDDTAGQADQGLVRLATDTEVVNGTSDLGVDQFQMAVQPHQIPKVIPHETAKLSRGITITEDTQTVVVDAVNRTRKTYKISTVSWDNPLVAIDASDFILNGAGAGDLYTNSDFLFKSISDLGMLNGVVWFAIANAGVSSIDFTLTKMFPAGVGVMPGIFMVRAVGNVTGETNVIVDVGNAVAGKIRFTYPGGNFPINATFHIYMNEILSIA